MSSEEIKQKMTVPSKTTTLKTLTPEELALLALEEWKLLSGVIARLEDTEYKIRSWLFPLLTGLAIAKFSENSPINERTFAIIGGSLVLAFLCMDTIHRIPKGFAMERAVQVEAFLRGQPPSPSNGRDFQIPDLTNSLRQERSIGRYLREALRAFRHGPYIPLIILIAVLTVVK